MHPLHYLYSATPEDQVLQEAAKFQSDCADHINLAYAEWLSYKQRVNLACTLPSFYMSLIFDYSNPIPLPSHHPLPKGWMSFRIKHTTHRVHCSPLTLMVPLHTPTDTTEALPLSLLSGAPFTTPPQPFPPEVIYEW
jgi:hypothetical protein